MDSSHFTFKHPTTILIAGPTQSGKTSFVVNVIKNRLISPWPNRIIWVTGHPDDGLDKKEMLLQNPNIEYITKFDEGLFDKFSDQDRNLLIMDDLMEKAGNSKMAANLFTQGSHHRNLTIIFLIQNLFYKSKEMRTISLNSHYLVLYKNPRDKSQIRNLAYQIFPSTPNFLIEAFSDATQSRYSYLLIDLHPETAEEYRIRTRIFPGEEQIVFLPK